MNMKNEKRAINYDKSESAGRQAIFSLRSNVNAIVYRCRINGRMDDARKRSRCDKTLRGPLLLPSLFLSSFFISLRRVVASN